MTVTELTRAERRRQAREGKTVEAAGGDRVAAAIDKAFAPTPKPLPTAAVTAAQGGATADVSAAPAPAEKPLPAAATAAALDPEQLQEAQVPKPGQKPLPDVLGKVGTVNPRSPSARKLTKAQQRREEQAAAERQAHIDSLRMPVPAPDNYKPGDTIPLHILNQRAREYDAQARDEANEIGKAVGKFAEEQVTTRVPRAVLRSKKARDAQDAMARARAKQTS